MIQPLNLQDDQMLQQILDIQIPAYQVEAALIGYWEIPPLKDTIYTLRDSDESFYGYFENEKLLGVISYKVEGNVVDLCRLVVEPKCFRRGIGRKLVAWVESLERDKTKMIVSTGYDNIPAKTLYGSCGFEEKEELRTPDGLRISLFEKPIQSAKI
ncbi:ribosomal protein S18 acetylase RimI-like enzyme [Anaerosolibacter carboniphilus]|uniref:Ribosomal protein S18 acetylase RimI-like enzyme n=1 Tax=Anaerosolibacter carboniphilus TaxID=1417629 RepID=A0A841KTF8_9FIRM|nr:GNAT family N-acetyltransferase [Anaerosolibacter carboniphilus]MBB6216876.1 ribosomal protein S18 acetylase RimI-like enzyme [Anaerosolibacter carboniphilus]